MKLLVFNQDWFVREWRQAGHSVITVGHSSHLDIYLNNYFIHLDSILALLPPGFVPDWIIFHDDSTPISITGLEICTIPLLFVSVDTHHHCFLHSYLADVFDIVLVAQPDYIPYFTGRRAEVNWLPLWASKVLEPAPTTKYETIFVGTMNPELNPERVQFFDELKKISNIQIYSGPYEEYFPFARMVVNQTVKEDVNFRVFETLMCGALLITESTKNGLTELFRPDIDLVLYERNNVEQVGELIRDLAGRREYVDRVRASGRANVLQHHLPIHRAEAIIDAISKHKVSTQSRSPIPLMMSYTTVARTLEGTNQLMTLAAFAAALRSLTIALERGTAFNEESGFFAVIACLGFDKVTQRSSGKCLLSLLCERFPQIRSLGLGQLLSMAHAENSSLVDSLLHQLGLRGTDHIRALFSGKD